MVVDNNKDSCKEYLLEEDYIEISESHTMEEEGYKDMEEEDQDFIGICVVEKRLGKYECPTFFLSKKEETRISNP